MKKRFNIFAHWKDINDFVHRDPFSSPYIYTVVRPFRIYLSQGGYYRVEKNYMLRVNVPVQNGPLVFTEAKLEDTISREDSFLGQLLAGAAKVLDVYTSHETTISWDEITGVRAA